MSAIESTALLVLVPGACSSFEHVDLAQHVQHGGRGAAQIT
jgi:hypothetical protein